MKRMPCLGAICVGVCLGLFGGRSATLSAAEGGGTKPAPAAGAPSSPLIDYGHFHKTDVLPNRETPLPTATLSASGTQVAVVDPAKKLVQAFAIADGKEVFPAHAIASEPCLLSYGLHDTLLIAPKSSGKVELLNDTTGAVITSVETESRVVSAQFSQDGALFMLALSRDENGIEHPECNFYRVFDSKTGQVVYESGKVRPISRVLLCPDGKHALITVTERNGDPGGIIWRDMFNKDAQAVQLADVKATTELAEVSPEGNYALTMLGLMMKEATLYDLKTGKKKITLKGHTKPITAAVVVGETAVTASQDTTLRVWNLKTGESTATLRGHSDEVLSVALCPDHKRVVSISKDKSARIWDIAEGRSLLMLKLEDDVVQRVEFSADGAVVLVQGEKSTSLWVPTPPAAK